MPPLNRQGQQITGRTEIVLQAGNVLADAGGRMRVSHPSRAFDSKNTSDRQTTQWQEITTGAGASISDLPNEAAVALNVGTASGERVVRQSDLYIPYVPGRSQQIQETFVMDSGKENLNQLVGFGDDKNMLAFVLVGTELNMLWRRSTSGAPVDTYIPQSEWNGDKLDGDGSSQITIDVTKIQFFFMDFLWQGAGSSSVEYSRDITSVIGGEQHTIDSGYIPTASGNKRFSLPTDLSRLNKHGVLSQSYDSTNSDLFVIYATTLSGAGLAAASLTWKEFE